MSRGNDLTGRRFGSLVVVARTSDRVSNHIVWRCRCDCGAEKMVASHHLTSGNVTSCGCAARRASERKIKDISGSRYGMLTVIEPTDGRSGNSVIWKCICDCGNTCFVSSAHLKQGQTRSCGCIASRVHSDRMHVTHQNHTAPYFIDGTYVRGIIDHKPSSKNTSGTVGVSYDKSVGLWKAYINFKRRRYYLGASKEKSDAIDLRLEAEAQIHGDFLKWYAEEFPELWAKINKTEDKS